MTPKALPSRPGSSRFVDALSTSGVVACGIALLLAAGRELTRPIAIASSAEPSFTARVSPAHVSRARPTTAVAVRPAVRRPTPHEIFSGRHAVRHATLVPVVAHKREHEANPPRPHVVVRLATPNVRFAASARESVAFRAPVVIHNTRTHRTAGAPPGGAALRALAPLRVALRPQAPPPRRRFAPRAFAQSTPEPPLGYDPMPELTRAVAAPAPSIGAALGGVRVRGRDIAPIAAPTPTAHP